MAGNAKQEPRFTVLRMLFAQRYEQGFRRRRLTCRDEFFASCEAGWQDVGRFIRTIRMSHIHIVNSLDAAAGGSAISAIELARVLSRRGAVTLWASETPGLPLLDRAARYGLDVRTIRPYGGAMPRGGTLVIGGVFLRLGPWLEYARPSRLIVLVNTIEYRDVFSTLMQMRAYRMPEAELVHVAALVRDSVGLPGVVFPSRVNLDELPMREPPPDRAFTVGRLSRDEPDKHHGEDPLIYRMLAADGCRVRVMGGTCLAAALPDRRYPTRAGDGAIELLPFGAEPVPAFLASLDAFYYRTGAFSEAFGRVVAEAMARGIPLVCGPIGGFVEQVEDGINGLIAYSTEDAYDLLQRLRHEPGFARGVAIAARRTVERMYSDEANRVVQDYYLG